MNDFLRMVNEDEIYLIKIMDNLNRISLEYNPYITENGGKRIKHPIYEIRLYFNESIEGSGKNYKIIKRFNDKTTAKDFLNSLCSRLKISCIDIEDKIC